MVAVFTSHAAAAACIRGPPPPNARLVPAAAAPGIVPRQPHVFPSGEHSRLQRCASATGPLPRSACGSGGRDSLAGAPPTKLKRSQSASGLMSMNSTLLHVSRTPRLRAPLRGGAAALPSSTATATTVRSSASAAPLAAARSSSRSSSQPSMPLPHAQVLHAAAPTERIGVTAPCRVLHTSRVAELRGLQSSASVSRFSSAPECFGFPISSSSTTPHAAQLAPALPVSTHLRTAGSYGRARSAGPADPPASQYAAPVCRSLPQAHQAALEVPPTLRDERMVRPLFAFSDTSVACASAARIYALRDDSLGERAPACHPEPKGAPPPRPVANRGLAAPTVDIASQYRGPRTEGSGGTANRTLEENRGRLADLEKLRGSVDLDSTRVFDASSLKFDASRLKIAIPDGSNGDGPLSVKSHGVCSFATLDASSGDEASQCRFPDQASQRRFPDQSLDQDNESTATAPDTLDSLSVANIMIRLANWKKFDCMYALETVRDMLPQVMQIKIEGLLREAKSQQDWATQHLASVAMRNQGRECLEELTRLKKLGREHQIQLSQNHVSLVPLLPELLAEQDQPTVRELLVGQRLETRPHMHEQASGPWHHSGTNSQSGIVSCAQVADRLPTTVPNLHASHFSRRDCTFTPN